MTKIRLVMVGLALLLPATFVPTAAYGHGESSVQPTNYRSELKTIKPAISDLTVVVDNSRQQLRLRNEAPNDVVVLGYEGEPYLKVGRDGVFANRRSPAHYLNGSPDGDIPVPEAADARASPQWVRQSGGVEVAWHDHRIHRLRNGATTADGADEHTGEGDWVVNLTVNGTPVEILGQTRFVPPTHGAWWLLAAGGSALLLAVLLSRWPLLVAPALVVMVVIDLAHRAAIVATIPSSGPALVNEALETVVPSLLAWGAAARAVRQLRRGDEGGWWFALFAGLFTALISGAARISTLMYSQTSFSLGVDAAKVLVVVALSSGLAVTVAAGSRILRTRRAMVRVEGVEPA